MSDKHTKKFNEWVEKNHIPKNQHYLFSAYLQGRWDAVEELAKVHNIQVEDD